MSAASKVKMSGSEKKKKWNVVTYLPVYDFSSIKRATRKFRESSFNMTRGGGGEMNILRGGAENV